LEFKDTRFGIIKARLQRGYDNKLLQSPGSQATEYLDWLNTDGSYITEEFSNKLPSITAKGIKAFIPALLNRMHVEHLAHGNVEREEALRWAGMVHSQLRLHVLPEACWPLNKSLILPPGSNYAFQKALMNPENVNHCLSYFLYTGDLKNPDVQARTRL